MKRPANQPTLALGIDDELDLLEILQAALVEEADVLVLIAAVPDLYELERTNQAHAQYAHFLADQGRFQEAYEQMRLARPLRTKGDK